ncbi:MAG: hypothetical protein J5755_01375, partial [Clostridia bacterium]|nr:hypothetical protein [Clostridia bacterium]
TPLAKGEQAQPEDVEGIQSLESSEEASRHSEPVEESQPLDSQSDQNIDCHPERSEAESREKDE